MKVQMNNLELSIKRVDIGYNFYEDISSERIVFDLVDNSLQLDEVLSDIKENFTGSLTFIDDNGASETYEDFELYTLRKNWDNNEKNINVEFKKK